MTIVTVTLGTGKAAKTIRISGVAEAGDKPTVSVKGFRETFGGTGSAWTIATISPVLHELDKMEEPYVCCELGMNRSPTMAILWLWKSTGETLNSVIQAVLDAYKKQAGGSYSKLVDGLIDDVLKPPGRRSNLDLQMRYDKRWG